MFKRLKDRLTEEPKQPLQKDLINLTDNSSEFFAISEDGETSEPATPLRQTRSILAPSDTESDRDEFHLDSIGKEQLYMALESVKSRYRKYKTRALEYSKTNAELQDEVEKLKHALAEGQDRTLRRVAELREQCVLEQQAKAHLEENLRLVIEEKEQVIRVLQTQIKLLKDNAEKEDDTSSETSCTADLPTLQERVKRQEALLAKCKETIQKNKERQSQLQSERETLSSRVEQLTAENNTLQAKESMAQEELRLAQGQLADLARQREEGLMAMAETKHNMHLELEHREKQLGHLRKQVQDRDSELSGLKSTLEDVVSRNASAELNWEKEQTALKKEGERQLELCKKQLDNKEKERAALEKQLQEETSKLKEALAEKTKELANEVLVLQQELEQKAVKLSQLELEGTSRMEQIRQMEERERSHLSLQDDLNSLDLQLEQKTQEINHLQASLREKDLALKSFSVGLETQAEDLETMHHEYSSELEALQATLTDLTGQLSALRQEGQGNRAGLAELEQELTTGAANLKRLLGEGEDTKLEISALSQQLDLCASKLSHTEGEKDSHLYLLEDLQRKYLALEAEKSQLSKLQEELQTQVSEQEVQLANLSSKLEEKSGEMGALEERNREEVSALKKELEASQREVSSLSQEEEEKVQKYEEELQAIHRQMDVLQDEISDKTMRLEQLASSHNEKDVEIASLKDQLCDKESQLMDLQKELDAKYDEVMQEHKNNIGTLKKSLEMQESQVESLKCQLREKEACVKSLEEDLAAKRNQVAELETKLCQITGSMKEATKLLESRDKHIESLEQELELMQEPLAQATQQAQASELRYKITEASLDKKSKEYELLDCQFLKTNNELEGKEKLVKEQEQKLTELITKLNEDKEDITTLLAEVKERDVLIEKLNEELNQKSSEHNRESEELEKNLQRIEELEQSLASREEVFALKAKDFQSQLAELQGQVSEKEQVVKELQASLQLTEGKLTALQEQHNSIMEAKKKEIGEVVTHLEKQLDDHTAEMASLEESTSQEIARLSHELGEAKRTKEELSQELGEAKKTKEELSQELGETKRTKEELSQELGETKRTKEELSQELATKCQDINILNQRLEESQTKMVGLESQLQELKSLLEGKQQELETTAQQLQQSAAEDVRESMQKTLEEHSLDLINYGENVVECLRQLGCMAIQMDKERDQMEGIPSKELEGQMHDFLAKLEGQLESTRALESGLEEQWQQLKSLQDIHAQTLQELDSRQKAGICLPLKTLEDKVTAELASKQEEIEALRKKLELQPSSPPQNDTAAEVPLEPQENHVEETFRRQLKQMVREFSKQLDLKEQECDSEITRMTEHLEQHEAQLSRSHRREMADIQQELEEKCSALVNMESYCQQLLQDNVTLKKSQSREVSEWENGWEDATIDPAILQDKQDSACQVEDWALATEDPHLPRPVEYEYLKNILFEYMMGKEPVILAKVIAAVMRFPEEQTRLILEREQSRLNVK